MTYLRKVHSELQKKSGRGRPGGKSLKTKAVQQAATKVGVSPRTAHLMLKLHEDLTAPCLKDWERGSITNKQAEELARLKPSEQNQRLPRIRTENQLRAQEARLRKQQEGKQQKTALEGTAHLLVHCANHADGLIRKTSQLLTNLRDKGLSLSKANRRAAKLDKKIAGETGEASPGDPLTRLGEGIKQLNKLHADLLALGAKHPQTLKKECPQQAPKARARPAPNDEQAIR